MSADLRHATGDGGGDHRRWAAGAGQVGRGRRGRRQRRDRRDGCPAGRRERRRRRHRRQRHDPVRARGARAGPGAGGAHGPALLLGAAGCAPGHLRRLHHRARRTRGRHRLHPDEGRHRHQARAQYHHHRRDDPTRQDLRQSDGGPPRLERQAGRPEPAHRDGDDRARPGRGARGYRGGGRAGEDRDRHGAPRGDPDRGGEAPGRSRGPPADHRGRPTAGAGQ